MGSDFYLQCGHITGISQKIQQNSSGGSSDSAHTNLFENQPFFAQKLSIFYEIWLDDPAHEAHVFPKFEGHSMKFE